jgi:hypothetical protein
MSSGSYVEDSLQDDIKAMLSEIQSDEAIR